MMLIRKVKITLAEEKYYTRLATAYIRGRQANDSDPRDTPGAPALEKLSDDDCRCIVQDALDQGMRIHAFKRTMGLARVARVLGILKGLNPESLLDIGSGRGAFLWPLLDGFPHLAVTAIDIDGRKVERLEAVRKGGVENLSAHQMSAAALQFDDQSFDVATLLETLEHIPDYEDAVKESIRVARQFVVLTVPSKKDDNPDHIHLFTGKRLRELFLDSGARRVQVDYVLNHIIVVATCR